MASPADRSHVWIVGLVRAAIALLVCALLVYPVDWAIWRTRVAAGEGMGTVQLNHITAASLKGNKDDLYMDGRITEACSRSLLPQAGAGACWWLARHPEVVEQY